MGALFPDYIDHIEQLHGPVRHGLVDMKLKKYKGHVARIEAMVSRPYSFEDPTNGMPVATLMQMIKNTDRSGYEGRQTFHLDWQPLPDESVPPTGETTKHGIIRRLTVEEPYVLNYMG